MTDLPPLNGLRAFEVSGCRLNFRAAAEEMGVTQGAVAQQVRQLEARLGIALFDRLPKGLSLTPAGRTYHRRVTDAFDELRAATAQLKPEPSKVVISVTPTFASKWLIPNLPDFSEQHPDIDLQILATENISSFHSDGVDLAVRQTKPPFGATIEAVMLFRHEVIAVASPELVAGEELPISGELLQRLSKIHDTHNLWPNLLAKAGISDESGRGLRLNQTALAVDAAISGQGAALVTRFLVQGELDSGQLIELGHKLTSDTGDFFLLAPRKSAQKPSVAKVISWLTSRTTR